MFVSYEHILLKVYKVNEPTQAELEKQFLNNMEQAAIQEQSRISPLEMIRAEVAELVQHSHAVQRTLATVGEFAPFFDLNIIRQEGVTDIDRIDQTYMLQVGKQILADYRVFSREAAVLASRMVAVQNNLNAAVELTENDLCAIGTEAALIQTEYVEWSERFKRIMFSAMSDIANHLNPLRPADRQINVG